MFFKNWTEEERNVESKDEDWVEEERNIKGTNEEAMHCENKQL